MAAHAHTTTRRAFLGSAAAAAGAAPAAALSTLAPDPAAVPGALAAKLSTVWRQVDPLGRMNLIAAVRCFGCGNIDRCGIARANLDLLLDAMADRDAPAGTGQDDEDDALDALVALIKENLAGTGRG